MLRDGVLYHFVDITKLDRKTELKPVDEQADDEIVHLDGSGKADSLSH